MVRVVKQRTVDRVPVPEDGTLPVTTPMSSAYKWLPDGAVTNPAGLIRAGQVQGIANPRDGTAVVINLVRQTNQGLLLPKHFPTEAACAEVDISPAWDQLDFGVEILSRDNKQELAWQAFANVRCGTLNIACGSGKTVLGLRKIAARGYPAIVIVTNAGLIGQWCERAAQFLGLGPGDIGLVQGSASGGWDKPLVLAMMQTLVNLADELPMELRQRFGTVIFDELHHSSARTFNTISSLFYGARFGLTATVERADGLEYAFLAHIGPVFYSDVESEVPANVYFMRSKTEVMPDQLLDRSGNFSASSLYKALANNKERNAWLLTMVAEALKAGRKVLVLTHSVKHADQLEVLMKTGNYGLWTTGVVHGTVAGNSRAGIISTSQVTFATFQIAKEGLDVASLDTLFLATPSKHWGAFQQAKGRVERRHPTKLQPTVAVLDDVNIGPAASMWRSIRRELRARGIKFVEIRGNQK